MIVIYQYFVEVHFLKVFDPSECKLSINWAFLEIVVKHIALHRELLRHWADHFHYSCEMIIVLLVFVARSWVEEEVSRYQLKHHTGIAPQVSGRIVIDTHDYFGSSVLPRLNLGHKVIVCPTAISKIAKFTIDFFVNERAFDINTLFLCQLFLFWVLIYKPAFGVCILILRAIGVHKLELTFA